jgi:alpha-amylase
LTTILKKLNDNNVMPIAEVILNHRAAPSIDACTGWYTNFQDPPMGNWAVVRNDFNENGRVYCPDNCGCGAADTGDNIIYAADLDHTNQRVRDLIKGYLSWLRNLGFRGFRYDATKGYSGSFVAEYNRHARPEYSVGEFFDGNRDLVKNWITNAQFESGSFDFPLHFRLKRGIQNDNYAELAQGQAGLYDSSVPPEYSTTFVQNHDTAKIPNLFFGSDDQKLQGYAYILTHPGVPCVFWSDYKNANMVAKIKELMALRKLVGLHSNSRLSVVNAGGNLYSAFITGKKGTIAMKLGSRDWSPDSSFQLRSFGNRFAIWVKINPVVTTTTINPPTTTVETATATSTTETTSTSTPSSFPPVPVRFAITRNTGFGDSVYVVGAFNNWDTCSALPCSWSTGNVWNCGPILLDRGRTYEFKPIQYGSNSRTTCRNPIWAPGADRLFVASPDRVVSIAF